MDVLSGREENGKNVIVVAGAKWGQSFGEQAGIEEGSKISKLS